MNRNKIVELLREVMTEVNKPYKEVDYMFSCPACQRESDESFNCGRGNWLACHECKISWWFGDNMFSGWKNQTEEEQREIFNRKYKSYKDVTKELNKIDNRNNWFLLVAGWIVLAAIMGLLVYSVIL